MIRVLVVDDVAAMRDQYALDLEATGEFSAVTAEDGKAGLERLAAEPVDCVLLDLEMPVLDGMGFLAGMHERGLDVPVVVYTGAGNYERCIAAVQRGAVGFLDKNEPMERVVHELKSAVGRARLADEIGELRGRLDLDSPLVGTSSVMEKLQQAAAKVAPIPSPVLVVGESGTGKELVARELHRLGKHAKGPFVAINCAALPENLVESELFGHTAGAFTGAQKARRGAFVRADGGTLFLDEIGEMPAAVQAKLLRVLEDGEVTPVGASVAQQVATRVVAATNRDLPAEVEAGRFRQDLLYRLNVHELRVPPLRERRDDVPALVAHFLERTAERFGSDVKAISPEAAARLAAHDWEKNNVRELRNIVERMVLAADGDRIELVDLPAEIDAGAGWVDAAAGAGGSAGGSEAGESGDAGASLKDQKAAAERRIVVEALERNGWKITQTAHELGLADHSSLLKIMRRHGLKKPE